MSHEPPVAQRLMAWKHVGSLGLFNRDITPVEELFASHSLFPTGAEQEFPRARPEGEGDGVIGSTLAAISKPDIQTAVAEKLHR